MLYRMENNILRFRDIKNCSEYTFNLPEANIINFVTSDKTGDLIAFTACSSDGNCIGIFIFDIIKGCLQNVYKKQAYDLMFDNSSDRLFFNSGNTINSIDIHTGEPAKLFKFSRVTYAPISLSQNKEGTHLSYHKWKSDNQRLYLFDLLTNTECDMGISFFNYSWIDNQHIIYSLNNGLVIFDINTKKSISLIRNANSMVKQYSGSENIGRILNMSRHNKLFIDNISKPVVFNNRIYFQVFLSSDYEKHIGIYSIAENNTDLKCHFSSREGLIDRHGILEDGETIFISIRTNVLKKENISPGIIYVRNHALIDLNGWHPVNSSSCPSIY